jgi:hypothetical protein
MWKRAEELHALHSVDQDEMYDEASRSACIKSRPTGWLVLNAQEGGWARIYSRMSVDTNGNTSATLVEPTDIKLG